MKHKIFSIHDQKAKAFLPPFFLPETGMALRTFGDCVNSQSHQFNKHPEDYTIFELGTFDDNTGKIVLENAPQSRGNGVEFIDYELGETPDLEAVQ